VVPYADLSDVRLYYERTGSGEPELLFVPGWCCDHTAFRPQFDHFARDHTVTAVDLRGIGQSDAPHQGYSIPQLADDLVAFCASVGIDKPVVVGHSLGGSIAIELDARHPSLLAALVLVDPWPPDPLSEDVEFLHSLAAELEGPNGEAVRRAYAGDMGVQDEALARWIVELMCSPSQSVAAAVIRGLAEWSGRDAFARSDVPALLLRASLTEDSDVLRLREIKPDLAVGITVGAGHFHQLEVPEQVNAMIERFLAVSL
jgi:pimeloyl-ACP methyl ester carboxylesterase